MDQAAVGAKAALFHNTGTLRPWQEQYEAFSFSEATATAT
jgi:hypothetical protein